MVSLKHKYLILCNKLPSCVDGVLVELENVPKRY